MQARGDAFYDKRSHSADSEASPPTQRRLGSYSNLYEGSQASSYASQPPSMGASYAAQRRRENSSHSLRGGDTAHPPPPPVNLYQRAASASPQRPHAWRGRAPMSPQEDLSPRSPTSLPNSPSGERFSSRNQRNGGWDAGMASLGRRVAGEGYRGRKPPQPPQAIQITSPYAVKSPGIPYSPTTPAQPTEVRDRARTYIPARSRSRENLNRSRENMSRSREYLSHSREGLNGGRSREPSVASSYQPSVNSMSSSQVTPNPTPNFVTALQLTELAEVRERESQSSRSRRGGRKESSRSVYDSNTSYEASV